MVTSAILFSVGGCRRHASDTSPGWQSPMLNEGDQEIPVISRLVRAHLRIVYPGSLLARITPPEDFLPELRAKKEEFQHIFF